ncbi:trans-aconitate 2-methyltransferase [soil metagenome]
MRWDPEQYERFADERARPFRDLLARVRASDVSTVVDLGCGPGTLTLELAGRWPDATVEGIDSSPDMVSRARALDRPPRVHFREQDLREWRPERPVDVIVSNATLQWVPGHLDLLPTLVAALSPSGWLAFQVPGNFAEPSHRELARLRTSPRWRTRLGADANRALSSHEARAYLDQLLAAGCAADLWETTYLHVLQGPDAVVEWMKGTGLRPVLSQLDQDEQSAFLDDYAAALRPAYPAGQHGTVLPFRRIFAVAEKRRNVETARVG